MHFRQCLKPEPQVRFVSRSSSVKISNESFKVVFLSCVLKKPSISAGGGPLRTLSLSMNVLRWICEALFQHLGNRARLSGLLSSSACVMSIWDVLTDQAVKTVYFSLLYTPVVSCYSK